MITRKQYMTALYTTPADAERRHREFYDQFVTPDVLAYVGRHIGVQAIKESTNPYFNDIPLRRWDALDPILRKMVGRKMAEANEGAGVSQADLVCVAKAAAHSIRDKAKKG